MKSVWDRSSCLGSSRHKDTNQLNEHMSDLYMCAIFLFIKNGFLLTSEKWTPKCYVYIFRNNVGTFFLLSIQISIGQSPSKRSRLGKKSKNGVDINELGSGSSAEEEDEDEPEVETKGVSWIRLDVLHMQPL